jgi:hypothetical protein
LLNLNHPLCVLARTIDWQQDSPVDTNSAAKTPAPQCGAVEPKIGHLMTDNRIRHCFLKGLAGDACSNLLKPLRTIAHALIFSLRIIVSYPSTPRANHCRLQIAAS